MILVGNMIKAKLVVVGGDTKYGEVPLTYPSVIGRGSDCDITLRHPLVSRRHCEILADDGHLIVRDLGSLNGTFVGKERISECELCPGELLTVGTVTFRAVYGDWTDDDDDAHVLSEFDDLAAGSTKISLEKTTLHADEDTKLHATTDSPHALVENAGDQVST